MYRRKLKNVTITDVVINDTGIPIRANSEYVIQPQDFQLWASSVDVVAAIAAGTIVVSDGENDLGKRVGIALLQGNHAVLNEFYTLVEEDGVLIGNGKILYLNDRFDTTENVPDYLDDYLEDDDPTEA